MNARTLKERVFGALVLINLIAWGYALARWFL